MSNQFDGKIDAAGQDTPASEGAYVPPQVQTYSPEEFLNLIGPAQGYGGGGPGNERGIGRGFRLFPGLR